MSAETRGKRSRNPRSGWIKVKTWEWKAAHQFRARLFENAAKEVADTYVMVDQFRDAVSAGAVALAAGDAKNVKLAS